jgi:histidine ammonia-lyase
MLILAFSAAEVRKKRWTLLVDGVCFATGSRPVSRQATRRQRENRMKTVSLDGHSLTVADVVDIARNGRKIEVSEEARAEIIRVRRYIDDNWLIEGAPPVYGFNTGVGKLKDYTISQQDNDRFQLNIVLSHCAGIGAPADEEVVRAMMAVRINAFCLGVSGLRIEVVDRLVIMLNRGVVPIVPVQGSLGASGDLAPLAHMVSVMIGYEKAEAWFGGIRMGAREALEKAGIEPVTFDLKAKDCLALINGNSFCAAMAALNLHDAEMMMKQADIAGALSLEAIRGELGAFDPRVQLVRKQAGQISAAENVLRLVAESRRTTEEARAVRLPDDIVHAKHAPRVQDQYSFRCVPQVHGSCRDNLAYVHKLISAEINAATDNPLVFWGEDGSLEFLSGGNFHCEPIAFAMDILAMSLAEIGNISERRLFALCDSTLNYGLPPNLAGHPIGLNTGYGTISGSAAAIASENKTLCFPSVADTIPAKSNQEDHNSMAAWSCRKTRQILDNLPKILGIEFLFATRAIYITDAHLGRFALGKGTAAAYAYLREQIPCQNDDAYMPSQTGPAIEATRSGSILVAVEATIGQLS